MAGCILLVGDSGHHCRARAVGQTTLVLALDDLDVALLTPGHNTKEEIQMQKKRVSIGQFSGVKNKRTRRRVPYQVCPQEFLISQYSTS